MIERKDEMLRSAISEMESLVLSAPSMEDIIYKALAQLTFLLNARFSYVYGCEQCTQIDGATQLPWQFRAAVEQNSGQLTASENICTSRFAPLADTADFTSGKIRIDNANTKGFLPAPRFHPDLECVMTIPLADTKRVYAVVYCCNAPEGFESHLDGRIRPFLTATICLLRAAERRGNNTQYASVTPNFQQLIDAMFNGVLVLDQDDRVSLCNSAAEKIIGSLKKDIIGTSMDQYLPASGSQIQRRFVSDSTNDTDKQMTFSAPQTFASNIVWRGIPLLRGNREKALVDLRTFELTSEGVKLRALIIDDISEKLRSTADYHNTLQRFQALTNLAPIAILQLNRNWECIYANDTWCDYTQMSPQDAHGAGWLDGLHPDDAEASLLKLRQEAGHSGEYSGQFRLQTALGAVTWVEVNACYLYEETGESSGLIMTFNDISAQLQNQKRLQDIAEKDQLTGLTNRAFFNDRLEIAMKGIPRFGNVVLMFCDLDEFKYVNDNLGHDVGDMLLKQVAERLRESVRTVDSISRIGGDEFTIIFTGVQNIRAMTQVADKIVESLNQAFTINDRSIFVTSSIGIAVAENDSVSVKTLMKQADVALYKAKGAGRNQYTFYKPEFEEDSNLHVFLRESLRETNRQDFRVVYQPQVNARTGEIVGIEALTRWHRDDMENCSTDKAIKMIEESGLMADFSNWLMNEVLSHAAHWQHTQKSQMVKVSINLSATQFKNKNLAFDLLNSCRIKDVKPQNITFEITETALIEDPKLAAKILKVLGSMGFGLSLDDFGTGYSSLGYLRDLPFDSVKIDRSFIENVAINESNAKIVRAIIGLAETLGLNVIAEGVENSDVKSWLLENNCDVQQGFFFNRPLERDQLTKLLGEEDRQNNIVSIKSHTS